MQNRLSQRKHSKSPYENQYSSIYQRTQRTHWIGDRNKKQAAENAQILQDTIKQRPYKIERWRLEEYESTPAQSCSKPKRYNSASSSGDTFDSTVAVTSAQNKCLKKAYSLPADNLLHLIFQNAFRGFLSNKEILSQLTIVFTASSDKTVPEFHDLHSVFPSHSVIFPAATGIPGGLGPTQEQMSHAHQTWIDLVPFPKMRDNLIKWEGSFDHSEFVEDVVGNFIDMRSLSHPRTARVTPTPSSKQLIFLQDGDNKDAANSGKGLILWGEPYLEQSWEATLGFLRKWAWAAEGCEDLIESTNHWRRVRGEEPIRLRMYT